MNQVLDELQFQLAEMAREIVRRESEIRDALPDVMQFAAFSDWQLTLQKTLQTH